MNADDAAPEDPGARRRAAAEAIRAGADHYAAGRLAEAEASLREGLRLAPRNAPAMAILGAILRAARRPLEALEVLDAALAIAPDETSTLINRANVLNELQRPGEALANAERALAGAPQNASALLARGNALTALGRSSDAIAAFREVLQVAPANAVARFNLGTALVEAGDAPAALQLYDEAAERTPGDARVHAERGHLLTQLDRWTDAAAAFDQAFALDPAQPYLAGQRLYARLRLCDWRDYDGLVADLAARIDAGQPAAAPFPVAALPLTAAQQLKCAATYTARALAAQPRPPAATPGPRIRLGYFSADFHDHATAYLMAEALELHDRAGFEVSAYSFGPSAPSPMRRRLEAACERFVDVAALPPAAICDLARRHGLDIAVDLKGYTTHARPKIFALGAAPIQVSFLGYPMTMGAPFMDYLIADRVLIPPPDRGHYSEQVAWLPHCYQPNDRRRATGPATRRADHELPADAFVFASFNGAYKIAPSVFALWMDLLRELPASVLWLLEDAPEARANLTAAAAGAGVDPGRLVFAPVRPQAQHLERIGHADLFLDSFPYTAHTTASDALWAGLPLVTRRGETFASRVAASILTAAGLPDLITKDAAGYRDLALALARDPQRLAAIRARVIAARSAPLFDTPRYVRALEDLYRRMHERRLAGLPPDHLPS